MAVQVLARRSKNRPLPARYSSQGSGDAYHAAVCLPAPHHVLAVQAYTPPVAEGTLYWPTACVAPMAPAVIPQGSVE